jgi:transitional endoplasmic reticulum ATPase
LSKEAAMGAIRRILPDIKLEEPVPPEVLENLTVTQSDFEKALKGIEPSALREVLITTPNETWDDVGGLDEAKQVLQETVEWPLKYPHIFEHLRAKVPKGILIYGLPGTGKTLLAKALAHESQANFIAIKGPEVMNKWVGESEKAIREIFHKARQAAPCIIFMDEIDSIAPIRGHGESSQVTERIVSQILTELDGIESLKDVVVVAATNRPDIIDPALLRAGRFGKHIEIGLPDLDARKAIFKIHLKNRPLGDDVNIESLAASMEGKSGADIEGLCDEATTEAIRDFIAQFGFADPKPDQLEEVKLYRRHFDSAMEAVLKTSTRSEKSYQKLEGALNKDLYS